MPDGRAQQPCRCGLAGSPLLADDVDRRGQGARPARHSAVEVGEDGSRPRLGRQPGQLAMDAIRVFPVRKVAPAIQARPVRLNAGALIFWLAAGAYLLIAGFTVLALNIVPGDSLSRVGIAERVLFSR